MPSSTQPALPDARLHPYDGDCVLFVKRDHTQLRAVVGDGVGRTQLIGVDVGAADQANLSRTEYDREGGVFYDPAADAAFMDAAVAALGDAAPVVRLDMRINDPECARTAVDLLLRLLRDRLAAHNP